MANKRRNRKITEAQIGSLYHMWKDAHRVHILKVGMEERVFRVDASVLLEDRIPVEYIKRDMARQLVDAVIAADLVKIDVEDGVLACEGRKIMRGSLAVMVPKGW